ncbi:hypothetical protein GCM10027180_35570 [Microbulbifer echini]
MKFLKFWIMIISVLILLFLLYKSNAFFFDEIHEQFTIGSTILISAFIIAFWPDLKEWWSPIRSDIEKKSLWDSGWYKSSILIPVSISILFII